MRAVLSLLREILLLSIANNRVADLKRHFCDLVMLPLVSRPFSVEHSFLVSFIPNFYWSRKRQSSLTKTIKHEYLRRLFVLSTWGMFSYYPLKLIQIHCEFVGNVNVLLTNLHKNRRKTVDILVVQNVKNFENFLKILIIVTCT